MVKELIKITKSFSWVVYFKYFHDYIYIYHVYQLYALIYGLKFILKLKIKNCLKNLFLIKMAPLKIDNLNFEN